MPSRILSAEPCGVGMALRRQVDLPPPLLTLGVGLGGAFPADVKKVGEGAHNPMLEPGCTSMHQTSRPSVLKPGQHGQGRVCIGSLGFRKENIIRCGLT